MYTTKSFIIKFSNAFYCLFPFSIAFSQKVSTVLILLWLAGSIFKLDLKNCKFNKALLLLPALYVMYLISMLVYPPIEFGILEKKVSLLAFPLIFWLNKFKKEEFIKMYTFFIYGCLFAVISCYIVSLYNSLSFNEGIVNFNPFITETESIVKGGNYFFGKHFSIFHQSIYASLYLNIALIGVLNLELFTKRKRYFLMILFAIIIFQISNKANIICMLFIFGGSFLYKSNQIKLKWIGLFTIIVLGVIGMTVHPRTRMMAKKLYTKGVKIDRESSEGYGVRLLVWDASVELVKSNFIFGVGASNTYSELKKVYKEKRYVHPYRNRLNSHNQFFQILIECGVLGFLLLIFQLRYLIKGYKKHQLLVLSIGVLFCFNFMFESVFNRYSGIMCYSFFYCYLICFNKATFPQTRS